MDLRHRLMAGRAVYNLSQVSDLSITGCDFPDRIETGQSYTVSINVENPTDEDIIARPTFHIGDGVVAWSPEIPPGEHELSTEFQMNSVLVSAFGGAGDYEVEASLEDSAVASGSVPPIQCGTTTVLHSEAVENLRTQFSDVPPSQVEPGETFSVGVQLSNPISVPLSANVPLTVDGSTRETRSVSLGPGEEQTFNFNITAPSSTGRTEGSFAGANWGIRVEEEPEPEPVPEPEPEPEPEPTPEPPDPEPEPEPEPEPASLSLSNVDIPQDMTVGQNYTISATISNSGGVDAEAIVGFLVNSSGSGSQRVNVPAGGSVDVSQSFSAPGSETPGEYGVQVQFGGETVAQRIVERRPIQPGGTGPVGAEDLSIESIDIPDSLTVGQEATIDVTIRNDADREAQTVVTFRPGSTSEDVTVLAESTRNVTHRFTPRTTVTADYGAILFTRGGETRVEERTRNIAARPATGDEEEPTDEEIPIEVLLAAGGVTAAAAVVLLLS